MTHSRLSWFCLCLALAAVVAAGIVAMTLAHRAVPADRRVDVPQSWQRDADASWYGKPGDRWSRRYPAAWYRGWPHTVGAFPWQCAANAYDLFTVLRLTAENGRFIYVIVTDRIGRENPPHVRARIDLTWRAFCELADPRQGLVAVSVEER